MIDYPRPLVSLKAVHKPLHAMLLGKGCKGTRLWLLKQPHAAGELPALPAAFKFPPGHAAIVRALGIRRAAVLLTA